MRRDTETIALSDSFRSEPIFMAIILRGLAVILGMLGVVLCAAVIFAATTYRPRVDATLKVAMTKFDETIVRGQESLGTAVERIAESRMMLEQIDERLDSISDRLQERLSARSQGRPEGRRSLNVDVERVALVVDQAETWIALLIEGVRSLNDALDSEAGQVVFDLNAGIPDLLESLQSAQSQIARSSKLIKEMRSAASEGDGAAAGGRKIGEVRTQLLSSLEISESTLKSVVLLLSQIRDELQSLEDRGRRSVDRAQVVIVVVVIWMAIGQLSLIWWGFRRSKTPTSRPSASKHSAEPANRGVRHGDDDTLPLGVRADSKDDADAPGTSAT